MNGTNKKARVGVEENAKFGIDEKLIRTEKIKHKLPIL